MDFEAVADELYGLAPEDFVKTRNQRAKQARSEGDRPLAELIASLRKPTMAAWLTNQLVRSHRDEMNLLLELGRELRDVMADVEGAELRELTKQRYQLVSALVQQARSLAHRRGGKASDDVAQAVRATLEATLSDEASAEDVRAGRLGDALEVSGFGLGTAGAVRRGRSDTTWGGASDSVESRDSGGSESLADLDAQRRRHQRKLAERELRAAQAEAERAQRASDKAVKAFESLENDRTDASALVERLRQELEEATTNLEALGARSETAQAAVDSAREQARGADETLAAAQARSDELSSPSE